MTLIKNEDDESAPGRTCPVTGLPILSKPEWRDVSFGKDYKTTLSIVGERILLSQPSGYATPHDVENVFMLGFKVLTEGIPGDRPYVHIEDYSNLRGSSFAARKCYIKNIKKRERLIGVIYCGLSPLFKISIKLGKRLNILKFNVQIVDDYPEAVKLALKILSDDKIQPDDSLVHITPQPPSDSEKEENGCQVKDDPFSKSITSAAWSLQWDTFSTRFEVIDGDIVHEVSAGFLEEVHIAPGFEMYDKVVKSLDPPGVSYYFVHDLTEIKGVDWKTRKLYIDGMTQWYKKYPFEMYIFYGANRFLSAAINISRPFVPFNVRMVKDLKSALELIAREKAQGMKSLSLPNNKYKAGEILTSDQCQQYVDEMLRLLGSIDWETDGFDYRNEVALSHPFSPVFDAIGLIKGELDDLSHERKRAEEALRKSEERFRSLVETTSDWIWELDKNGVYTYVSPKVKDILGYEPGEVIGKTPLDLMPQDEAERVSAIFGDIVATQRPFERLANVNIHKDGRFVVLDTSGVPIFAANGNLLGYRGIDRDITERKLAEDELKYQKKRLESLIRYSSLAIVTLDDNHNVISCNRYFEDLFQFKESEILNKNLDELISGQKYLEDARAYTRKTREGEAIQGSGKRYRKDGTSIDVEFFGVPVIVDGKVVGAYGIYRDIGERKQAEEALRKAHEELEQRVEERTAELSAQMEETEQLNRAMTNILDELEYSNQQLQEKIAERKMAEKALLASESKFRTLHESSRDAVMVLDEEEFIDCNSATLEIFGCARREEFCGKHPSELSPPTQPNGRDSRGLADERIATAIKKGSNFFEWLHRRMDGTDFPAEVLLSAMELEDKPVIQAVVRDITERKRAEEELRKYQENLEKLVEERTANLRNEIKERKRAEEEIRKLSSAVEQSIDGVAISDLVLKLTYVNDAYARMHGYSPEEMIGMKVMDLHSEEQMGEVKVHLNQVKMQGSWAGEIGHIRKDGASFPTYMSVTILKDAQGKPTGILAVTRDITEQKTLQTQLRQAQKMEAIGTLAGGIAHDFNNILGAIIGYTELTLDDVADNVKVRRRLEKVLQSGERARDLVQQILTFTRQTDKERSAIRISPIIKEALKLLRATLPTTIQINEHMEAEADQIFGDPVQIHQVVMNLCTNAKHAMREGGGILEVTLTDVTLDSEVTVGNLHLDPGNYLNLTVSDTGHGVPGDIMERIFDPYFTTKAKGEGTGLGLSMVHGIVEDHGGAINVLSEEGKGTTFKILLPVSEDQGKAEQKPERSLLRGTENILLVDDEELLVEAYSEMLESLGYHVVVNTSSREALEVFRKQTERFDLVLTDYTMPNMTGIQLAEELLKIRPDIPIILYSGFTEDITPEQAKQRGAKEMLSKPLNKYELSRILRQYLS